MAKGWGMRSGPGNGPYTSAHYYIDGVSLCGNRDGYTGPLVDDGLASFSGPGECRPCAHIAWMRGDVTGGACGIRNWKPRRVEEDGTEWASVRPARWEHGPLRALSRDALDRPANTRPWFV